MMNGFGIQTPGQVLFGRGMAARAAGEILALGPRGVLVHGASAGRAAWLVQALRAGGGDVRALACPREPDLPMLEAALAEARAHGPAWVVGLGGGAALDMGKALAALIPSAHGPMDHLEGVGGAMPLAAPPLPFVALPSTAGTGAEATRNAVIGLPEHRLKVSLRDARMMARLAIVDPALTDDCPWGVTLASGMDAVVQVIEAYLCLRANDVTDALARPAIARGLAALQRLAQAAGAGEAGPVGGDAAALAAARDEMAFVSLCGGMALANAGLGAVHGLAGPIGGASPAPHGAICAVLLAPVLAMNIARAEAGSHAAQRLHEVCAIIAQGFGTTAEAAPAALAGWLRQAGLGGLAQLGLQAGDHAHVARAALRASSMQGNPVRLSEADLRAILDQAAG